MTVTPPKSRSKKLFCVVEQGSLPNQDITLEHKQQFNKPYCDFHRVNWWTDDDPNAAWTLKHSQVSETRNFLYQKTRGQYEYYIFIDDDIRFSTPDNTDVAETIKHNLLTYRPMLAGFFSDQRWKRSVNRDTVARCGFVHDMDCMVLSADFAEVCFPTIYHGVDWTHDYMYFLALALYPEKYHIYLNVDAVNTRYHWLTPDSPHHNIPYDCRPKLLNLARPQWRTRMTDYLHLRELSFSNKRFKHGQQTFGMLFNDACRPATTVRSISLKDVSTVLNTEHPDFINRSTMQSMQDVQKIDYLLHSLHTRSNWTRFLFMLRNHIPGNIPLRKYLLKLFPHRLLRFILRI